MRQALDQGDVPAALDAWNAGQPGEGDPSNLGDLQAIAAALLEAAARGDDPRERRAAIGQLGLAGAPGRTILGRIGRDPDASPPVAAAALAALARRGDRGARDRLRRFLDTDDQRVRGAAALSLEPGSGDDRARLLALLDDPSTPARQVAAQRLRRAAPDPEVRLALARTARVDPSPGVRATAVRSLGRFGEQAFGVLRERLSDPAAGVRMAAVAALVQANRPAAEDLVGGLFAAPPGRAGIEAARLVLQGAEPPGDDQVAAPDDVSGTLALDARTYLRGALVAGEPSLRAQAGIALSSLRGWPELEAAVAERLPAEPDPGVRLSLAVALISGDVARDEGRAAIEALLDIEPPGMPTLQAAAIVLDRRGDPPHPRASEALALLEGFLARGTRVERQAAARALAREAGAPAKAARGLGDDDPLVRIHAAGGILAASG